MAKKVRLEFTYSPELLSGLKAIFRTISTNEYLKPTIPMPQISIITRMTEHDISEGPTKMIEATEIIYDTVL